MRIKKVIFILLLVFSCFFAEADNIKLSWCPSPEETNSDFVGYNVYYSTNVITTNWIGTVVDPNDPCSTNVVSKGSNFIRGYSTIINVGRTTTAIVSNLTPGLTYYFAVTAYGMNGMGESDYSDEFRYTVPIIRSNTPPSQPQNFQVRAFALTTITNGLLLNWGFEEGSGTSTADNSGHALAGAFSGTNFPTWVNPCIGNSAINFDGTSFVSSPTNTLTDPGTNDMSFALWFKTSYKTQTQVIGGKCSPTGVYYLLELSTSGNLTAAVQCEHNSPNAENTSGINYCDGNWHYAVMVWNATTLQVSLYADGIFVGTSAGNTSGLLDPGGSFTVGGVPTKFANLPFIGSVDEVSIYNRQLAAPEIASLFKNRLNFNN